jgi:hypothetical protein
MPPKFTTVGTKLQGKDGEYVLKDEIARGGMGATKGLPSLRKANPTVSKRTEQVIFKSMEIDPEERFQSARRMREALCPRRRFIPLPF